MYLPFKNKDEMLVVVGTVIYLNIEAKVTEKMADIKAGRRAPDKGAACNAKCSHG